MPTLSIIHLLPLATSSATLALSIFQYPIFGTFIVAFPSIAGQPLSIYWSCLLKPTLICIVIPIFLSAISGFATARDLHGSPAASWYTYGAVCALAHFGFVPFVAPKIRAIAERKSDKALHGLDVADEAKIEAANRRSQETWLRIHFVRTITFDVVAVICFYRGALSASS